MRSIFMIFSDICSKNSIKRMTCNCYCIKKLGKHQSVLISATALTHTHKKETIHGMCMCIYG